jgi:hypothetical protein
MNPLPCAGAGMETFTHRTEPVKPWRKRDNQHVVALDPLAIESPHMMDLGLDVAKAHLPRN